MASIKVKFNKVYKCWTTPNALYSIVVKQVDTPITLKVSNYTAYQDDPTVPDKKKLIVPNITDMTDSGDGQLTYASAYTISSTPEWIAFTGSGEVWIPACLIDRTVTPED